MSVQVLVAVAGLWASHSLHVVFHASLTRHEELKSYRRQVQAVCDQLDEPALKTAASDSDRRRMLAQAAQQALAVETSWPSGEAADVPLPQLESAGAGAVALAVEAATGDTNGAAQRRLEQARTQLLVSMRQIDQETHTLEESEIGRLQKADRAGRWTESLEEAALLLMLATVLYVGWLKRAVHLEAETREESELELRRERSRLEQRVDDRTEELRAEVRERRRTEQLNRGRNRVLEMLARDEPTPRILETLVQTVANHGSTWMCALHRLEGECLTLAVGAGLPSTLAVRLQFITTTMVDAPEAVAVTHGRVHVIPDLCQEHKTWCELLVANAAQSVWSAPVLTGGGKPLGTISIYTLLKYSPAAADIELLEMSCQMASLILERHRMNEELVHSAYHDALTGLGNRRHGKMGLDSAIRRARRYGKGVGVLWIDLNKFKQINDTHGHQAGDHVLQVVAKRLTGRMRASDMLARMGGDEFMVVLESLERPTDAEEVAADLLELIAQPIGMNEMRFSVAASIGMSFYPEDGESAEILEQNADLAMYEAKFGGQGLRSFTTALKKERAERKLIEVEMRRALEHGGFSLVYQPQCLPTGELVALEALLRFQHPELENVPPSRFIPIAEDTQLILPLGRWVLREVCRQIQSWKCAGYRTVPVAVNISSLQFIHDDFSAEVAKILEDAGVSPALLELELTESIVMKDFAESAEQMQKLKDLGVRIAIDDFGTGYSSLSYLHRLPIDSLKIDRSFVEMINEREGTLPIVEAVISMAHTLGLRVVGEGVETVAQMDTLRKGGCDVLQGYLFSRPVAAEQAAEFLRSGRVAPGAGGGADPSHFGSLIGRH